MSAIMMTKKPATPQTLAYLAALTDEGLMLESLTIHQGIDLVLDQLERFKQDHEGTHLTAAEADWQRRASKALELLRHKRLATNLLIRTRRLAGHLYPDAFVQAAEETLEDGTFERISSLAANRVLEARDREESQRLTRLDGSAESLGNR